MNEFVLADPDANLLRFGEEIASSDIGKTM